MGNIVQEEFDTLRGLMFEDIKISDGQKKDMERSFYAGALAVNAAVLKCSQSENPEKDLADLFEFIQQKGEELIGDKNV